MHNTGSERPLQLALIGAGLFTKDAYIPLCRSILLYVGGFSMPPALANACVTMQAAVKQSANPRHMEPLPACCQQLA